MKFEPWQYDQYKHLFCSVTVFALLLTTSTSTACDIHGKTGFFPQDVKLQTPSISYFSKNGVEKDDFEKILKRIEKIYKNEVKAFGATLKLKNEWKDDTVNAYAMQKDNEWIVSMHGGLARYKGMTKDAFTLVACHELGHHLGGVPKNSNERGMWSSVEGQADYFATLKCFRRFAEDDNNKKIVKSIIDDLPKEIISKCEENFSEKNDQRICLRSSYASYVLAEVMRRMNFNTRKISFTEKSKRTVRKTYEGHPDAQCRLDSLVAGSQCSVPTWEPLSDSDLDAGSCTRSKGFESGLRPSCWFASPESE